MGKGVSYSLFSESPVAWIDRAECKKNTLRLMFGFSTADRTKIICYNHFYFVFISVAYAQIDWHDFVVVETVDFQPNEGGNVINHNYIDETCVSTEF